MTHPRTRRAQLPSLPNESTAASPEHYFEGMTRFADLSGDERRSRFEADDKFVVE